MANRPLTLAQLSALIAKHRGSYSAIAVALTAAGRTISREAVRQRAITLELEEEAVVQRARAGLPGPRPLLEAGSPDKFGETVSIEAAALQGGTLKSAAAKLGLSRRGLYRRRKALGMLAK